MKKDLPIAITAIIVVAAICYGLAVANPQQPPPPSPALPTATTAVAVNERVVMHVNGEPVTEREFNAFAQQAPEQARDFYMSPDGRALLAEQLVKLKALEQEARRLGVESDPELRARLNLAHANFLAGYALQKMVSKPSEARLRAEYEKEKKNFETIQLSHILIAYQGGSVPPRQGPVLSAANARRKADAMERLLRQGADFGDMARSNSDDVNSALQGGQLGPVSPGSLPAELQGPVASLKENEISKPVQSPFGIHIFKAGARSMQSFDAVKQMFVAKFQREEADALLSRLQKSAKVELDPKFFPPRVMTPRGRS
ncbi:MAG TPA: peptidylprolyl isomerase [Thermoanaerobaculia bacterium]|jgi:parvulin-like peptidyl-prolyl isomerase|nr:peptidylprolyl isomerase [Thermoanaerobaculia bacterium]